jgi:hypothetical protein
MSLALNASCKDNIHILHSRNSFRTLRLASTTRQAESLTALLMDSAVSNHEACANPRDFHTLEVFINESPPSATGLGLVQCALAIQPS